MADGGRKPSFLETVIGVITAIVALITAFATLITALYTAKIIGQEEPAKKEIIKTSSHDGGGTWGAVLQMFIQLHGTTANITVRKKDGAIFNSEYRCSIRLSSQTGTEIASSIIAAGSTSVQLQVDIAHIPHPDIGLYAFLADEYGYAWVGPVYLP